MSLRDPEGVEAISDLAVIASEAKQSPGDC